MIAASTRLKQRSTQAPAAEIAERQAEDRGWTFSMNWPTARVRPPASTTMACWSCPRGEDEKPYSARLDAMLAIHLFNPEGKSVKSLPAGEDEATAVPYKALTAGSSEPSAGRRQAGQPPVRGDF